MPNRAYWDKPPRTAETIRIGLITRGWRESLIGETDGAMVVYRQWTLLGDSRSDSVQYAVEAEFESLVSRLRRIRVDAFVKNSEHAMEHA